MRASKSWLQGRENGCEQVTTSFCFEKVARVWKPITGLKKENPKQTPHYFPHSTGNRSINENNWQKITRLKSEWLSLHKPRKEDKPTTLVCHFSFFVIVWYVFFLQALTFPAILRKLPYSAWARLWSRGVTISQTIGQNLVSDVYTIILL